MPWNPFFGELVTISAPVLVSLLTLPLSLDSPAFSAACPARDESVPPEAAAGSASPGGGREPVAVPPNEAQPNNKNIQT